MKSHPAEKSGYSYRFADRLVFASIPLPTLTVVPGIELPDFRVVSCTIRGALRADIHRVHSWLDEDGAISMSLTREADERDTQLLRLRISDQCDFLICPATGNLEIEAVDGVDNETIEHLLIDQVLPRLLAQEGNLVIHASVVESATGAMLFVGKSGWGKSTLAGIFHEAGYGVLSDDCAVLQTDETDSVRAIPTYPSLRLFDDSLGGVFRDAPATTPVAIYSGKQRVPLDWKGENVKKAQVLSIYILDDPTLEQASGISIQPVPSALTCMALVENSFRLDVTSRHQSATIFQQAAAVSRAIPGYSLRYPRNYSNNAALVQALALHFSAHSKESA